MSWLNEVFGAAKPIVGMCHLPPLPGDPLYDPSSPLDDVVDQVLAEVAALEDGGVDGILFSNEFSLPYLTATEPITAISMARVIGELRGRISVPFGVNVLWDGIASIDLAVATGAAFVREIFTGVYASDFGLWDTSAGRSARHRRTVGGDSIKLLFNIVPEGASYLADRPLSDIARSTVFNARPDALCVSGLTAGRQIERDHLVAVKDAVPNVPVFVNTGVNSSNVADLLSIADGAIVGTHLKTGGVFENAVDETRVRDFMDIVRRLGDAHGQ